MPIKDPVRRREVQRAATARYRLLHPDRVVAYIARRDANDPTWVARQSALYQQRHPDRMREVRRSNYERHAERRRQYARDWAHANRERRRRVHAEWAEANPEMVRAQEARRYARVRGAQGSHTAQDWIEKLALFGGCCAYCGRSDRPLSRDHNIPLSRGGTNFIGNILPACRPCNSAKRDRTAAEYFARRAS
jgi:5-methylcytosine-specific restriction endonuclease McrA